VSTVIEVGFQSAAEAFSSSFGATTMASGLVAVPAEDEGSSDALLLQPMVAANTIINAKLDRISISTSLGS
jgi:hypothetical protein